MTERKRISIAAKPRKEFTVDLVGQEILVKAPKSATAIAFSAAIEAAGENGAALLEEVKGFLKLILTKKDATKTIHRLEDPNDDLDVSEVMELVKGIMEEATGDPTT